MTIIEPERVTVILRCGPCRHEEHIPLEKFKNQQVDCDKCLGGGWMSTMDLKGVVIKK